MAKEAAVAREKDNGGPRSLTRLLGLFAALARSSDGMSLADLNVVLESPKSSLLNLLLKFMHVEGCELVDELADRMVGQVPGAVVLDDRAPGGHQVLVAGVDHLQLGRQVHP